MGKKINLCQGEGIVITEDWIQTPKARYLNNGLLLNNSSGEGSTTKERNSAACGSRFQAVLSKLGKIARYGCQHSP